jgi:hypothetical protein
MAEAHLRVQLNHDVSVLCDVSLRWVRTVASVPSSHLAVTRLVDRLLSELIDTVPDLILALGDIERSALVVGGSHFLVAVTFGFLVPYRYRHGALALFPDLHEVLEVKVAVVLLLIAYDSSIRIAVLLNTVLGSIESVGIGGVAASEVHLAVEFIPALVPFLSQGHTLGLVRVVVVMHAREADIALVGTSTGGPCHLAQTDPVVAETPFALAIMDAVPARKEVGFEFISVDTSGKGVFIVNRGPFIEGRVGPVLVRTIVESHGVEGISVVEIADLTPRTVLEMDQGYGIVAGMGVAHA